MQIIDKAYKNANASFFYFIPIVVLLLLLLFFLNKFKSIIYVHVYTSLCQHKVTIALINIVNTKLYFTLKSTRLFW